GEARDDHRGPEPGHRGRVPGLRGLRGAVVGRDHCGARQRPPRPPSCGGPFRRRRC
ncbi:unnamed protein product, partial [Ectocarpus sp. 12 AP-2014]